MGNQLYAQGAIESTLDFFLNKTDVPLHHYKFDHYVTRTKYIENDIVNNAIIHP